MNKKRMFFPLFCLLLFACEADVPESRSAKPAIKTSEQLATTAAPAADVARPAVLAEPDFEVILGLPTSELRDVVALYSTDRSGLLRRYDVQYSPARRAWLQAFYEGWRSRLVEVEFDALGVEGRIDYVLLGNQLRYELELLAREEKLSAEMETFMPFAGAIIALDEARRRMESVDPATVAAALATLTDEIEQTRKAVEEMLGNKGKSSGISRIVALRASRALESLQNRLERWFEYYAGYDPLFNWWVTDPYNKSDAALEAYVKFINEEVVGFKEGEDPPIVGDPIGAEGMRVDLIYEMIPYSPEELIDIGKREYAWCETEMKKAAAEMGFGDDWKAALEKVKTLHVEPGRQPDLVRDLAHEAVAFLQQRDLLTIPPLAEETWRIEMMSPERQKVSPFFTGGETIRVSFPTDEMTNEEKLMSMRGNNIHFSRATVHHELIPGHHLQGFMTSRYNSHRRAFSTPFWTEGWALYWEMLLFDLGFPQTPEDRVGMLFWRMHRAARIIFSLSFHLGTMTPQEAIDFLIERVGHERSTATGEVRRSFYGDYPPLYQVAYMIGGLQIRALHEELVGSGRMTNREFHDAILQGGNMSIEMVRARLTGEAPSRDFAASWRFYGD